MKVNSSRSAPSIPECTNGKVDTEISFNKTRRMMFISFVLLVLFTIVSLFTLDVIIAEYCKSLYSYVEIRRWIKTISKFGIAIYYLVFTFLCFVIFKYIKKDNLWTNRSMFVFVSIASTGILISLLKFIFGRYRPKMLFTEQLYGFSFFELKGKMTSFPSGHAGTIVAFMLCLYFINPRYKAIYLTVALVIVASRVILCHHYLSDVVFGAYLAVICTVCLKHFFEKKGLSISPG